jgi:ferritin
MIKEKVEKAINEQIKKEEYSSRLYLQMASWCEVNGFKGAAEFLYAQADEERVHMLKFVHYLNDRGGHAKMMQIEQPPYEFKNISDIFEQVMEHEIFITNSINDVYEVTLSERDHTSGTFLQWFINEQIEEESTMSTILDKIKLVGEDKAGYFHIDKELEAMAAARPAPEAI